MPAQTPEQKYKYKCCPEFLYGKPYTTASCADYCEQAPGGPQTKLLAFGNYCGRTNAERVEDARARLDNRVYFLGITAHGYQKPIREAMNPSRCYRDKYEGGPVLEDFIPNTTDTSEVDYAHMAENFRSIDVYSGLVDGKNYGRFNRLYRHKLRHTRNPHGTEQRFCVPIANSMNYGWWTRDNVELNRNKWFAPRVRYPQVRGEITRFVDEMAVHDPNFIMF